MPQEKKTKKRNSRLLGFKLGFFLYFFVFVTANRLREYLDLKTKKCWQVLLL